MIVELADVAYVRLIRPAECRLLRHLMDAGTWVPKKELLDALYGHRADGGPLGANNTMAVHICRLRKLLKPGFYVTNIHGRGFQLEATESALAKAMLEQVADRLAA